jgi:hypothetical protein
LSEIIWIGVGIFLTVADIRPSDVDCSDGSVLHEWLSCDHAQRLIPSQWTWRVIPFLIERNGHFQVVVIAFVGHGQNLQISKELVE